ncbi:DUF1330 domain-containing protein [Novosphingobium lentum]|uniref:DUF1330 domain-containing protein n=1 Tax=Novosphingobium lentum TaxID=145287 RepID=UPI00082FE1FE|nr:DUF1330 domain-containing protein [Novosphingobium lentum]
MAGYMIALVNNRNTDWLADYMANVPAIIASFGGSYLGASTALEQAEGTMPLPDQAAIFRFPSVAAIRQFLACDAYAPYAAARQAAAATEILMFESE